MQTPDVNVLVAAFFTDHPHHQRCFDWLTQHLERLSQGQRLVLLPVVCASFLRLVTNRKVFERAAPIEQALAFVDALLAHPGCEMVAMGPEWPVFVSICRNQGLAANAIPDAWIAASARHQGLTLVTLDRDFLILLSVHELHLL